MSALGDAKYRESRGGPRVRANGDTITLKRKSYHQAQERQRVAEARVMWAEKDVETSRAWARDCLAQERRAYKRCEYLYGLAASLGATAHQLQGPESAESTPGIVR